MNKWGIFAQGFCAASSTYALLISVFGDFSLKSTTEGKWVLSEHPAWRLTLVLLFLVGLVYSIYSAWKC